MSAQSDSSSRILPVIHRPRPARGTVIIEALSPAAIYSRILDTRPDRRRLSLLYRQNRRYIFPPRHEPTEDAVSKGKEKRKPKADKSKKKGAAPAQAGSVTTAFAKKPQKA
jgi:hypothetical protein